MYNESNWSDLTITIADVELAVQLNVGLTNTGIKEAYMDAFKETGGKIISYHGRFDSVVPSELSEWYFTSAGEEYQCDIE